MSSAKRTGGSSRERARLDKLRELGQRQTRFFIGFAAIEGVLIVMVVAAIYGLKIIDITTGVIIMGVIAVVGVGVLLVKFNGFTREREELTRK